MLNGEDLGVLSIPVGAARYAHVSKMQYDGPEEILRELLFCSLFSYL